MSGYDPLADAKSVKKATTSIVQSVLSLTKNVQDLQHQISRLAEVEAENSRLREELSQWQAHAKQLEMECLYYKECAARVAISTPNATEATSPSGGFSPSDVDLDRITVQLSDRSSSNTPPPPEESTHDGDDDDEPDSERSHLPIRCVIFPSSRLLTTPTPTPAPPLAPAFAPYSAASATSHIGSVTLTRSPIASIAIPGSSSEPVVHAQVRDLPSPSETISNPVSASASAPGSPSAPSSTLGADSASSVSNLPLSSPRPLSPPSPKSLPPNFEVLDSYILRAVLLEGAHRLDVPPDVDFFTYWQEILYQEFGDQASMLRLFKTKKGLVPYFVNLGTALRALRAGKISVVTTTRTQAVKKKRKREGEVEEEDEQQGEGDGEGEIESRRDIVAVLPIAQPQIKPSLYMKGFQMQMFTWKRFRWLIANYLGISWSGITKHSMNRSLAPKIFVNFSSPRHAQKIVAKMQDFLRHLSLQPQLIVEPMILGHKMVRFYHVEVRGIVREMGHYFRVFVRNFAIFSFRSFHGVLRMKFLTKFERTTFIGEYHNKLLFSSPIEVVALKDPELY